MSLIERDLLEALHRAHAALDKGHDHTAETWDDRERWKDVDPATYQGAVDALHEALDAARTFNRGGMTWLEYDALLVRLASQHPRGQ